MYKTVKRRIHVIGHIVFVSNYTFDILSPPCLPALQAANDGDSKEENDGREDQSKENAGHPKSSTLCSPHSSYQEKSKESQGRVCDKKSFPSHPVSSDLAVVLLTVIPLESTVIMETLRYVFSVLAIENQLHCFCC